MARRGCSSYHFGFGPRLFLRRYSPAKLRCGLIDGDPNELRATTGGNMFPVSSHLLTFSGLVVEDHLMESFEASRWHSAAG